MGKGGGGGKSGGGSKSSGRSRSSTKSNNNTKQEHVKKEKLVANDTNNSFLSSYMLYNMFFLRHKPEQQTKKGHAVSTDCTTIFKQLQQCQEEKRDCDALLKKCQEKV
jgi:hypothetical protein